MKSILLFLLTFVLSWDSFGMTERQQRLAREAEMEARANASAEKFMKNLVEKHERGAELTFAEAAALDIKYNSRRARNTGKQVGGGGVSDTDALWVYQKFNGMAGQYGGEPNEKTAPQFTAALEHLMKVRGKIRRTIVWNAAERAAVEARGYGPKSFRTFVDQFNLDRTKAGDDISGLYVQSVSGVKDFIGDSKEAIGRRTAPKAEEKPKNNGGNFLSNLFNGGNNGSGKSGTRDPFICEPNESRTECSTPDGKVYRIKNNCREFRCVARHNRKFCMYCGIRFDLADDVVDSSRNLPRENVEGSSAPSTSLRPVTRPGSINE